VALIPSNLQVLQHPAVVYRPLAAPANSLVLEAALVWRATENSPALASFLDAARERYAGAAASGD